MLDQFAGRAASFARGSGLRLGHGAAFAILALATAILWVTAPQNGEFWWSDSPRHALNGVFVRDFFSAFPWRDPERWAMQYYLQYPALTILFYPPLFYFISAPYFALFGVSHQTALSVVMIHYAAAAFGLYVLARRWMRPAVALAVGLSLLVAPGVALWGRQVMLEIPSMAFAIWAIVILRSYGDSARPSRLYWGAFLLLCAVYTKITAIFLVPVLFLMLLGLRGGALRADKHSWIVGVLFAIALLPLAILTLKFGRANVESVVGIADANDSRTSIAGWTWYARQIPEQLGWPIVAAMIVGHWALIQSRKQGSIAACDLILLIGWVLVGYLFFSSIDLKEARHSTIILPPLLIVAGLAAERYLGSRTAPLVSLSFVAVTGYATWQYAPVPQVQGYREAAEWITEHTPPNSVVLFSGKRDGSFVFNLRALDEQRQYFVIRSDKLLLDVAVRRELGVTEKEFSETEISEMLDRYAVRYVVAQSDFWTDLVVMRRLQAVLQSGQFREERRIVVVANIPVEDTELRIYQNMHDLPHQGEPLKLDLPIIGVRVQGEAGAQ